MQQVWADDLDLLLDTMPPRVAIALRDRDHDRDILEIVMDLGRMPEARYPGGHADIEDLDWCAAFDNRREILR